MRRADVRHLGHAVGLPRPAAGPSAGLAPEHRARPAGRPGRAVGGGAAARRPVPHRPAARPLRCRPCGAAAAARPCARPSRGPAALPPECLGQARAGGGRPPLQPLAQRALGRGGAGPGDRARRRCRGGTTPAAARGRGHRLFGGGAGGPRRPVRPGADRGLLRGLDPQGGTVQGHRPRLLLRLHRLHRQRRPGRADQPPRPAAGPRRRRLAPARPAADRGRGRRRRGPGRRSSDVTAWRFEPGLWGL